MGKPFIVSIHVPKTAGTSLALILTQHLEGCALQDYRALFVLGRLLLSYYMFSRTARRIDLEAQYGRPLQLPVLNTAAERPGDQRKFQAGDLFPRAGRCRALPDGL